MALTKVTGGTIADGTVIASDILDGTITDDKLASTGTMPAWNGSALTDVSITGIDDNADATAITIDVNENVGIGTGDPSSLLHINYNGSETNDLVNMLTLTTLSTGTTTTGFGSEIRFQAERNNGVIQNTGRISSVAEVNLGTDISSGLGFWTSTAGALSERVRISYDGNVGIGTDSPGGPLEVNVSADRSLRVRQSTDDAAGVGLMSVDNASGGLRDISIEGEEVRLSTGSYSTGTSTARVTIKDNGAIGIASNTDPYWPKGIDAYHSLSVASDGSTDDFADLIGSSGITQIGRKIFASFNIHFPNGESNKAYRFYFGDGDDRCAICAKMQITATYSYVNSMGYREYYIERRANSGTAIYMTRNDDLHSFGNITSHLSSNGWGYHSATGRHYIELRHLNSSGNPYRVDFEFYGYTDRDDILNMQVQKVGY